MECITEEHTPLHKLWYYHNSKVKGNVFGSFRIRVQFVGIYFVGYIYNSIIVNLCKKSIIYILVYQIKWKEMYFNYL